MDAIVKALKETGISRGVQTDFIVQFVARWNTIKKSMVDIPVAESPDIPISGIPGRLEILAHPKGEPEGESASGKVDFREKKTLIEVAAGQDLARWHPPKAPQNGVDLFGENVVPPVPPGNAPIAGPGVEVPGNDPSLYRALRPGFLRIHAGTVEVGEHYVVDGDVDYSSGNITYLHSVRVTGDVRNGFHLKVGGDLRIDGIVEDSFILCSGDLIVGTGCVGTGKGLINIKGSANIGFVTNQAVKSRVDILIERDSMNANLYGAKMVQVLGHVVGGQVMAGELVHVGSIGNDSGTRTEIELGKDYFLHETLATIQAKIEELIGAVTRISLNLNRLREKHGTDGLTGFENAQLLEMRMVRDGIEEKMPLLQEKKSQVEERIRQEYFQENLKIKVEKKIHPGTVIKVCGEILTFNETLSGPKTIAFSDGRLKIF